MDTHAFGDEVEVRGRCSRSWRRRQRAGGRAALGAGGLNPGQTHDAVADRGFAEFWGPLYRFGRPRRSRAAARRRRRRPSADTLGGSSSGTASRSTRRASTTRRSRPGEPDLRRAARPRSIHPRAGDRAHRDVRRHERGRAAVTRATPGHRRRAAAPRPTPPSRRRPTTRWRRCSRRRLPLSTRLLAADLADRSDRGRRRGGHRARSAGRGRHPRATRQ